MAQWRAWIWVILAGIVVIVASCLYIVRQDQQALLLRLGQIVKDSRTHLPVVKKPGLHFKIPIINQVRLFDVRLQTLDIDSSRVVTAEKKDVLVDSYAKWRISDLPLYYVRTSGNLRQVQLLLQQKLNDGLRAEFGKRDISDVVSGERVDIMKMLRTKANEDAKALGVTVIDVRIKRIDLPEEVSQAVYGRMRAERARVATQHRAEGESKAVEIRANADRSAVIIVARAQREAKRIYGDGEAQAAKIYAGAYGQDPEFFAFYRSLSTYQNTFNSKNDVLVLKPDGEFFKYLLPNQKSAE